MQVTIRTLKAHLSEYLRRARSGEEIVVTSRGKVVGRLLGPPQSGGDPETETLVRLRAQPWIRPGQGGRVRGSDCPVPVPPGTTDEILRWVRGE